MIAIAAFAPLLALLGALINGFFGRQLKEPVPGWIASAAVGASFLVSLLAFFGLLAAEEKSLNIVLWQYLSAGSFNLSLGFTIDTLSSLMMLIITGVGLLIHIYSIAYMHGDEGYSRYFSYLNLFIAAMLVLVMADSFLLMFIGWEGVGVCSYLLIGFWYSKRENPDAARKAFIVNRIGDVGFLLAMFLTFYLFGTLNIQEVNAGVLESFIAPGLLAAVGLLYLLAATGKSAQLPLQVWLPDAMAGPTPVSALIHAATMVTAGVYLIARAAPLFAASPMASGWVAWIGVLTALVAAFAALSQTDIKKILAYSTISQLGFMFVAVGCGAYWVGIFHVFTHAFFKALLFLASGSVIHALGGEQDIRRMGGLGKHMKITGTTALIGTLAIAGVPFLAGFFSKDAILAHVFTSQLNPGVANYLLFGLLLLTAVMTAFYMFRWYYVVFAGEERLSQEAKEHLHESPQLMTVPLMILAGFSVIAGYLGLPEFAFPNWIGHWLDGSIAASVRFSHPPVAVEWLLIFVSVLAAAIGLGLGYWLYHLQKGVPVNRFKNSVLTRLSQSGAGFDGLYKALFTSTTEAAAGGLSVLDKEVVDKGIVASTQGFGVLAGIVRRLQTGYARAYALLMFLAVAVLTFVVVIVGGQA
ncbi:MAG: NADH-quinone oxidoreductase subunit L [Chloroflexi bacterium AL-N5]|nr:NADH-quinone oxidoreductase subunit L [Chloroflexi bacterium AL-N5]